jgi:hypothetical protein
MAEKQAHADQAQASKHKPVVRPNAFRALLPLAAIIAGREGGFCCT